MDKQEFLEKLRVALSGRISPGQVIDNINFYEDYINTQVRMGRTEREVLGELGDPRLIARTIIAANGQDGDVQGSAASYRNAQGYESTGNYQGTYQNGGAYQNNGEGNRHLPRWFWVIFGILIVVLVIGVLVSVLSFLLPIAIPIMVVLFLVKLFRDWLN